MKTFFAFLQNFLKTFLWNNVHLNGRHDIQLKSIQHIDAQHNNMKCDTHHKVIQYSDTAVEH
jgi:hypothetical protein